jgi:hypothetical protein
MAIEMGGQTFTPGTYRSGSAINFAHGTVVTLDGLNQPNPQFLFIAGSTLVTAADTKFILTNGAKAEHVVWALGTAATLGARSVVEGSILAGTAITFGSQSVLHGCALAQSAVTFESQGYVAGMHKMTHAVSIVSKAAATSRSVHCAHFVFSPAAVQVRKPKGSVNTSLSTLERPSPSMVLRARPVAGPTAAEMWVSLLALPSLVLIILRTGVSWRTPI